MPHSKYRILISLVVMLSLLSIGLVAQAQDTIELQVNWWGSQNRHDRTIQAIELFKAANPGVEIVYEFAGFGDYWTLLNTKAAGEQLPCVMQQDYAYLAEWQSRGLLAPLGEHYESGAIDVTNVPESLLAGGLVGDEYYGISLGTNSQSIIVNTDLFEQAGMELPSADWTWTEFEEVARALHENLGIWAITSGSSGLPDVQVWRSMNLSFGQTVIGEDGVSLGITDWQPTIDHFNLILRLQNDGVIATQEEAAEFTGLPLEQSNIVTGLSAMQYQWSNQVVAVFSAMPDSTLKLWHLPRAEGGPPSNYLKPSMFFSITSQCETPELAASFINFFTNDLAANDVLFAERGVPISTVVAEYLLPNLDAAGAETFDFIERVTADSSPIPVPDPPNWSNFTGNVYGPLFSDPVLYGQITPEEAVVILETEGNAILGG
jgi:multiple sugar transport system substrate-binding protein